MRRIRGLSKDTIKMLKTLEDTSSSKKVRQRAKCIQLSHKGYSLRELSDIFDVSYITIVRWLNNWDREGFVGLYDQKGRGRKPTFSQSQIEQIKSWVKENPQQIKVVQSKIEQHWDIKISTYTIKRITR